MPGVGGGGSFSVTPRVQPGRSGAMVEATLSRGLDWRLSVDYEAGCIRPHRASTCPGSSVARAVVSGLERDPVDPRAERHRTPRPRRGRRAVAGDRLGRPRESDDLRDVRLPQLLRLPAREGRAAHDAGAYRG